VSAVLDRRHEASAWEDGRSASEQEWTSSPGHWGVRAALFALSFYKAYLSVLFAGTCRYEPTCSRYAYQAIERFGVARGVWLGLKRLLCCHPLSGRFGYDPVPEKWEKMRGNCCDESLQKGKSEDRPLPGEVRS